MMKKENLEKKSSHANGPTIQTLIVTRKRKRRKNTIHRDRNGDESSFFRPIPQHF